MELHILFILRKGEHGQSPEARIVWDEYSIDENPEGFREAVDHELKSLSSDVAAHKVVRVRVNEAVIDQILRGIPDMDGEILG